MEKQEFLEKMRFSLSGKVAAGVVAENISYYENYINTEIRKGKSEEEVLTSLGDPRLIARTIVETSGGSSGRSGGYRENGGNSDQGGGYRENGDYSDRTGEEYEHFGELNKSYHSWLSKIPGWLWLVLLVAVLAAVLSAVFHILAFFAPVIIVVTVVMFFIRIFRDWLN